MTWETNEITGNIDTIVCKTCLLEQWKNRLGFQKYRAKRHLNTKSSAFLSAGLLWWQLGASHRTASHCLYFCCKSFHWTHVGFFRHTPHHEIQRHNGGSFLWVIFRTEVVSAFFLLYWWAPYGVIESTQSFDCCILSASCVTGPALGTAYFPWWRQTSREFWCKSITALLG